MSYWEKCLREKCLRENRPREKGLLGRNVGHLKRTYVCSQQSEEFKILLSLRFYVKSILDNLEVLKLPIFAILGALKVC